MSLLEVRNLTYGYEDDPVIKDITLKVNPGEILLIDGENGVGKTTLLKCITGVLNNGAGVYINDQEVSTNKKLLKNISFVMSDDFLYDYLSVEENINFFKKLLNEGNNYDQKILFFMNSFGIQKFNHYLVKNLSQGTRNKVYIAIMLSKQHNVLILDEPFTALDVQTQKIIIDYIKQYIGRDNQSVIMVTHINEFKKIATKTFNMKLEG